MSKEYKYYCTNCGGKVEGLFKKYSETVLKLTECKCCNEIADKYVEYDIVIIIIDLILLNTKAYRHILLNTDFKHFWKLSVVLILLESYCIWALSCGVNTPCKPINKTEPKLHDFDMNTEDLKFYVICLNTTLSYLCFVAVMYFLTVLYNKYLASRPYTPSQLALIVKTATLSSTGIFLQLPSIIWDMSLFSYHLHFITLYTWLCQLLAYKVICPSPKIWCLLVIFSAHILKSGSSLYLTIQLNSILHESLELQ
uniref:Protein ARV n=1 Tax=Dendroctonus ponderosae TaxID=77166 RepID=A0AAR5QH63_DENPD